MKEDEGLGGETSALLQDNIRSYVNRVDSKIGLVDHSHKTAGCDPVIYNTKGLELLPKILLHEASYVVKIRPRSYRVSLILSPYLR